MPQFAPDEARIAIAPIRVVPPGLSCQAEIFLGPDETTKVATSGMIAFTSTGVSQDVRLPVTLPDAEGTYHVFIDIYTEGLLIAAYKATEDVVITAIGPHILYFKVYPSWEAGSISISPDRPMTEVGPGFPGFFQTTGWNLGDIVTMTAHPNPGFTFTHFAVSQPVEPKELILMQSPASFSVVGNSTIVVYFYQP